MADAGCWEILQSLVVSIRLSWKKRGKLLDVRDTTKLLSVVIVICGVSLRVCVEHFFWFHGAHLKSPNFDLKKRGA